MWNARQKGYDYAQDCVRDERPLEVKPEWSQEFRKGIAQAVVDIIPFSRRPETGWYVWNRKRGMPTVKHASLEDAKKEALRLASEGATDDQFVVLQIVGKAKARKAEATWESTE